MNREEINVRYKELIHKADKIIKEFDIRDKNGKITDSGYSLIYKICERVRSRGKAPECIEIIGKDTWNRLTEIWKEMKFLTNEDKNLLKMVEK